MNNPVKQPPKLAEAIRSFELAVHALQLELAPVVFSDVHERWIDVKTALLTRLDDEQVAKALLARLPDLPVVTEQNGRRIQAMPKADLSTLLAAAGHSVVDK